jgi:hypothetical protein
VHLFNHQERTEQALLICLQHIKMKATLHQGQVMLIRHSYARLYFNLDQPDMLGFKLEVPRREDAMSTKTRPIYLDMQVSLLSPISNTCVLTVHYRLRHPSTLEFLMPCCLILQINMVTLIVGPMLMDGKPSKLWRMRERYYFSNCSFL